MIKDKKILIIGFGSAGQNHANSLIKISQKKNIFIYSKNKNHQFNQVDSISNDLNSVIDYVIISNMTSQHLQTLKLIDRIFHNKIVLIEKPLGTKIINNKFLNNTYYVAYNLRYHPLLIKLKKMIKELNVYNINISCMSYLPNWRSNKKTYSHYKLKGGGVEYDLSHEIDYMLWLFGDVSSLNVQKNRISDITHDSNDLCSIHGKLKNKINFQIFVSYFSQISQRKIIIDTNKNSICLDFIKNNLIIKNKRKEKLIKLPNFKMSDTYFFMHKDILSKKKTNYLPNISFNNKTQRIINFK